MKNEKNLCGKELIEALTQISKAITSERYLDDILKLIVVVTAQLMGSNICSIMLVNEKTNQLIMKATQSMSELYNKKKPLKVGEGIAGRVIQTKKPIAVKDISKSKEYLYKEIAKKEGLTSMLSVPLSVKGRIIGVLNCYTPQLHVFSENEKNILVTIANQAAIAIENTELIVKSKVIREELESRKFIERAKGMIMKEEGISEAEAYMKIRKFSMDNRKTMREIAEAIILSGEMRKI